MKTNTSLNSIPLTRRGFMKGVSAGGLLLAAPRIMASQSSLPSLRGLAGGRPLIGTAVPTRFNKEFTAEEAALAATQFDSLTPANCMKWPNLCPKEGEYRFEPLDQLMEFAAKNKQSVVGHTLIFNRDGQYPAWLFKDGEKEADAKLVWKRIEDHMAKLMSRYAGRIDSWDVLNEFVEVRAPGYRVTDLTRVLGADYPERLFKIAAEIDPKAKMMYNDFDVERPDRLKAILAFVRSLRDKGCKIDVVGSQSHLQIGTNAGESVDKVIKQFAAEGFRCALTEVDVDVIPRQLYWNPKTREEVSKQNPYREGCPAEILEQQATVYREVMESVVSNIKHVDRVTFWGISDRYCWLNIWPWNRVNYGMLFDREARPKPAFHAVADVLKKKKS